MISKATALRVWKCYSEIENANKLIAEMEEAIKNRREPNPKDVFGNVRKLELGVPCDRDSMRVFSVEPQLAISILKAHAGNQHAQLVEANEQARIEINELMIDSHEDDLGLDGLPHQPARPRAVEI